MNKKVEEPSIQKIQEKIPLDNSTHIPVKSESSDQSDDDGSSSPSIDSKNFSTVENKRKREREQKSKHEKKRRIKFNEQLALLRTLLCANEPDNKKLSREYLLNAAIQEIAGLRQRVSVLEANSSTYPVSNQLNQTYMQVLETICLDWSDKCLSDLLPNSLHDMERAFQLAFSREFNRFMDISASRTEQQVLHTIRILEDMSTQIGKQEYQLSAGLMEQMYHITLKFNPREYIRCLKRNWALYQSIKKSSRDNLILYFGSEVGCWILTEMSLIEYMTGNTESSERTYGFAKQLCKRFSHQGTSHFMLANLAWNLKGIVTIPTAEKIKSMLKKDYFWEPMGNLIEGRALIAVGKHKEGLEEVEHAFTQLVERIGDAADVFMAPALLDAYVQTRSVDKGIWIANYLLNKCAALNIEGLLGKEEILRQKANLLIMKLYPDFIPEAQIGNYVESSIQEILALADQQADNNDIAQMDKPRPYNPLITQSMQLILASSSDSSSDNIEVLLRASMNLARSHDLHTVELWCCMDLTRFFLHCGERLRALETVELMRAAWARMKGSEHTREFQRARDVISLAELS